MNIIFSNHDNNNESSFSLQYDIRYINKQTFIDFKKFLLPHFPIKTMTSYTDVPKFRVSKRSGYIEEVCAPYYFLNYKTLKIMQDEIEKLIILWKATHNYIYDLPESVMYMMNCFTLPGNLSCYYNFFEEDLKNMKVKGAHSSSGNIPHRIFLYKKAVDFIEKEYKNIINTSTY